MWSAIDSGKSGRPSFSREGLFLELDIDIVVLSRPRCLSRGKVGRRRHRRNLRFQQGQVHAPKVDYCNSTRTRVKHTATAVWLVGTFSCVSFLAEAYSDFEEL